MVTMVGLLLFLSACGRGEVTAESTGLWERIVYYFAAAIRSLSIGGSRGIGIILFTVIIRVILLPLMHFQTKSMRKVQDLQPELKKLQQKYAAKDMETQQKLREETQRLYAEKDANPYMGCLPMLVQMPILMAIYQAISRVPDLSDGSFLWLQVLGKPDPYFILPILAAFFTFLTTYLSSKSQLEVNPSMKMMNFIMPAMILFMGATLPSALSLYWVISNAFQVGQTLLLNNPYKIIREREEIAKAEREREKALRKMQQPKKKRKK